jgi:DUF1009 family protein
VVSFDGHDMDASIPEQVESVTIGIGQVGKALSFFNKQNVSTLVFVGGLKRPSLRNIKTDLKGGLLLSKLLLKKDLGDDRLLSSIIAFLEKEGMQVVGVDAVAEDLIAPVGVLGAVKPSAQEKKDVELGYTMAKEIGRLDIGQGVLVHQMQVLGVEAVEGTDHLIARCSSYRKDKQGGVLVKVCKPQQDRRVDLPTIGVNTIKLLSENGFKGVAIESGSVLVLEKERVVEEANRCGLFVLGISV